MATDPSQLYPVIAQIAAAFAGFGSLASGLGRRRGGDDARVDASRLGLMLFASLSAALLGLLPATLAGLFTAQGPVMRVAAIIAIAAIVIYSPGALRRSARIRHVAGFSRSATFANAVCTLTALAAFALCALDVPADRVAGLYLLGLMALLGSAVVMFSRVIVSMLRPHSDR